MNHNELGSWHRYTSNLYISKSAWPRHRRPVSQRMIRGHSDIDYWYNVAISCSESRRTSSYPIHCGSVWVLSIICICTVSISCISGIISSCCVGGRSRSKNSCHPTEYVGEGTWTLVYVFALSSLESWHGVWFSLLTSLSAIIILSLWLSRRWRSRVVVICICRRWWCLATHLREFSLFLILTVSSSSEIDVSDIDGISAATIVRWLGGIRITWLLLSWCCSWVCLVRNLAEKIC